MPWVCYGQVLALLAAVTLTLSVADIILTLQFYCVNGGQGPFCSITNDKEPYWPIWVASGIWGSAPVFLAGILAICSGGNAERKGWFKFLVLLSAIVFTPAIVILTAVELWRGSASKWSLYTLASSGLQAGTIKPGTNPYEAKFALPLMVTILGGIMFIMTMWVTLRICCCGRPGTTVVSSPVTVVQQPVSAPVVVYERPRPQILSTPPPRCDPCSQYPSLQYSATRFGGGNAYNYFPQSKHSSFYYGYNK